MFLHKFKQIIRSLWRVKRFTFINVPGLCFHHHCIDHGVFSIHKYGTSILVKKFKNRINDDTIRTHIQMV